MTDIDQSNDLQQCVSTIVLKCRSIIKMIKKSTILTSYIDKLKPAHRIQKSLSIDCKSRWNSTKHMLENLISHKQLIIELHSNKYDLSLTDKQIQKLASLELSNNEWRIVAFIESMLTPFDNATKLMSGQKYCTIGTCLFAIRKIKAYLDAHLDNNAFMNELNNALLEQLVKYIDDDVEQMNLIIVCMNFNSLTFDLYY